MWAPHVRLVDYSLLQFILLVMQGKTLGVVLFARANDEQDMKEERNQVNNSSSNIQNHIIY